jgi:hypothetical protein
MKSNVFGAERIHDTTGNVASFVHDLLLNHYGPQKSTAILVNANRETIATADGIKIAKNVSFDDVYANYVKDLICHVGQSVDNACHDGTTTAMLLVSGLLRIGSVIKETMTKDEYVSFMRRVRDRYASYIKFPPNDAASEYSSENNLLTYVLAYHTARISSNGNDELAKAVATAVAHSPENMFGLYKIRTSKRESTALKYSTYKQKYTFEFRGSVCTPAVANHNAFSEYMNENVDVIITTDYIIQGNPNYERVIATLKQKNANDTTDLVIISPQVCPNIEGFARKYNTESRSSKIIVMTMHQIAQRRSKCMVVDAIAALVEDQDITEEFFAQDSNLLYLHGVSVWSNWSVIGIGGLYTQRQDSKYTEKYISKQCRHYNSLLRIIRDVLEHAVTSTFEMSEAELQEFISIYKSMVVQTPVDLEVSGMITDIGTNVEIARDAYGAAMSTIEKGYVVDGLQLLYRIVEEECSNPHCDVFKIKFKEIMYHMLSRTYTDHYEYVDTEITHGDIDDSGNMTCHRVIQSGTGWIETIDRLIEIIPTVVYSTAYINGLDPSYETIQCT